MARIPDKRHRLASRTVSTDPTTPADAASADGAADAGPSARPRSGSGSDVLSVIRGGLTGDAPLDTAVSRAILRRVTDSELGETLQIGTPHKVVAFGKHDTLTDGFDEAVDTARQAGFDPTIRIAGGRAVVFSPTIVRFAWTVPTEEPAPAMHARFRTLSSAVVDALAALGIASEIGEVPHEYCAGEYSVHVLGNRKVMGVGQRLTRSAAQVGGMIVVDGAAQINEVLVPIYEQLGVPMDPDATGALADVRAVTSDDVGDALAHALAAGRPLVESVVDDATMQAAEAMRDGHDPDRLQRRSGA